MESKENIYKGLIISGPSGIGKTYLAKYLQRNHHFDPVLSTTTRSMLPGEIDGVEYHFLTDREYKTRVEQKAFFMSNSFLGSYYGFERKVVEDVYAKKRIPIAIVFTSVIDQYLAANPDHLAIYLLPAPGSEGLLQQRMLQRGDFPEKIERRLRAMKEEVLDYEQDKYRYYHHAWIIGKDEDISPVIQTINSYFPL